MSPDYTPDDRHRTGDPASNESLQERADRLDAQVARLTKENEALTAQLVEGSKLGEKLLALDGKWSPAECDTFGSMMDAIHVTDEPAAAQPLSALVPKKSIPLPLTDGQVNALHSRVHVAAPNAAIVQERVLDEIDAEGYIVSKLRADNENTTSTVRKDGTSKKPAAARQDNYHEKGDD